MKRYKANIESVHNYHCFKKGRILQHPYFPKVDMALAECAGPWAPSLGEYDHDWNQAVSRIYLGATPFEICPIRAAGLGLGVDGKPLSSFDRYHVLEIICTRSLQSPPYSV